MQRTDFLIVGGGLAGVSAADALRAQGAPGTITLVSGEAEPPHDRPPLSKEFLRGERTIDQVLLHPPKYYAANRIRLLLGRPALALDPDARELHLADGESIQYDRLLLATGGRPRKLGVPGETMRGIYELRTLAEAERIRAAASESRCPVVVGAGFIGMEVAASLTARGLPVTVLNMDERMWPASMPASVAELIQQDFEARGVRFRHLTRVIGFDGVKDELQAVSTNQGDVAADMVVIGAGIQLNTELAAAAGLQLADGIVVDEYLQTSAPAVFAAGDVASFPNPLGERRRVEHWDNAVAQGRLAAANMADMRVPFAHVPYFWSDLFDTTINVVGCLDGADETLLRGTLESRRFSVLFLRAEMIRGALMVNRARDRRSLTELIAQQTPIGDYRDRLADPDFDATALARASARAEEPVLDPAAAT